MDADNKPLLDVLLDSWDRNNTIMLNLLRLIPAGGLEAKATPSGPTVGQQFMHLHHERLISVSEEAPEHAVAVPTEEWAVETDRQRIMQRLVESAGVVRTAVEGRVRTGRDLDRSYDHPALMLQLLLWHEAYHHGQMKLALKLAGRPIADEDAGPSTWAVWRHRSGESRRGA